MSLIATAWMCHGQFPWLGLRTQAANPTLRSTFATWRRVVRTSCRSTVTSTTPPPSCVPADVGSPPGL